MRAGIHVEIIGNKAIGGAHDLGNELLTLKHRMAAFHDLQFATVLKLWSCEIAGGSNMGEARKHVDLGECERGLPDTFGLCCNRSAQLGKEAALNLYDLLLSVEHLSFVFLEFRRGIAFRIDQRLLALVVRGRMMQIGLGDLNVIAEDVVELDLERVDPGALPLAGLDLCDVLLAMATQVAQLVEFRIDAFADHATVVQGDGWFRNDAVVNTLAYVS